MATKNPPGAGVPVVVVNERAREPGAPIGRYPRRAPAPTAITNRAGAGWVLGAGGALPESTKGNRELARCRFRMRG